MGAAEGVSWDGRPGSPEGLGSWLEKKSEIGKKSRVICSTFCLRIHEDSYEYNYGHLLQKIQYKCSSWYNIIFLKEILNHIP